MAELVQYFKFMSDIIDSGLWARLSPGAKTLYPVLLKFSDQNFKHVWPSTSTLLKLTGFKTKKSIINAKKELINEGLIFHRPGNGRTSSTYYFSFNYTRGVSQKAPQEGNTVHPTGKQESPPEVSVDNPEGSRERSPNQINITITNTQALPISKKGQKKKGAGYLDELRDIYGDIIIEKVLNDLELDISSYDTSYLKSLCELKLKAYQSGECPEISTSREITPKWFHFLQWSENHLTAISYAHLVEVKVEESKHEIKIYGNLNEFIKKVISKYFSELPYPILIHFYSDGISELRKSI